MGPGRGWQPEDPLSAQARTGPVSGTGLRLPACPSLVAARGLNEVLDENML